MAVFAKTEIDVLREAVRKTPLVPLEESLDQDQQSTIDRSTSTRDQLKLAIKVWTSLGKFIRCQCNKGRVIDSLCFGTFAKASATGVTTPDAESYYVYCTGPNSAFTNQENRENVPDIPQPILEEKLVQISFSSVAALSRCTPESVKALLNTVKSESVDLVHVKGHALSLNFMVGQLMFSSAGSVEFKSAVASDTVSNFSSLASDLRSQVGNGTDRGLRQMQVDQSLGCKSPLPSNPANRKQHSAFVNKKRFVKDSAQALQDSNGNGEYGHLSSFLKNHIANRKERTICTTGGGSRRSHRAGANNAIIEQAAKLRYDLKAVNDLVEQSKSQCGGASDKVSQKSKVAMSADEMKDWKTMNTTHIHKPQYTMPNLGHLRHKTVGTPNVQTSARLMPGQKDVNLDFNNDGITNERALYRHSDSKLNNIISKSVNRKNISYAYHTGYPIMMNAQGPYAVYSHKKRMGEHAYQAERKTRKAAYNRFEDDLRNLTNEREAQRDQFFGNIREEQMLVQAQRKFQLATNKQNQEVLKKQIEQDKRAKAVMFEEERKYKKPHFGPEETYDVIEDLTYEDRLKKYTVSNNLKAQIQHREDDRRANDAAEKACDRENLERFIAVQNAEMQAQREKIVNDKRKLKKAWEKQAAMRNHLETVDNTFK